MRLRLFQGAFVNFLVPGSLLAIIVLAVVARMVRGLPEFLVGAFLTLIVGAVLLGLVVRASRDEPTGVAIRVTSEQLDNGSISLRQDRPVTFYVLDTARNLCSTSALKMLDEFAKDGHSVAYTGEPVDNFSVSVPAREVGGLLGALHKDPNHPTTVYVHQESIILPTATTSPGTDGAASGPSASPLTCTTSANPAAETAGPFVPNDLGPPALPTLATPQPASSPAAAAVTPTPTPSATTASAGPTNTPTPTPSATVGSSGPTNTPSPTPTPTPTSTTGPSPVAPIGVTPGPGRASPTLTPDAQYFSTLGFRVDDRVWDYFNNYGGLTTFGYPVSRLFELSGCSVQFFQRRVVQKCGNDSPTLLNLLDPEFFGYADVNGSHFPAIDASLKQSTPPVAAADYSQAIVEFINNNTHATVGERFIDFAPTYFGTAAAAQIQVDPALLPLLNLEMWGAPTSPPMADPTNPNFVYQRFQRGIMHFMHVDGQPDRVEGVLLADYLKAIIRNVDLPDDLRAAARSSNLYAQYCPERGGNWVCRPADLSGADFTDAFEPG